MTRRRRDTSDDEKALFRETFRDVRPLEAPAATPKTPMRQRSEAHNERKRPHAPTPVAQSGLAGRTAERLRRGLLEPEARLDLHGMTEEAAHSALIRFVESAQARGLRLVLVVTGKGSTPTLDNEPFDLARRPRGVLNAMVPRWLKEPALAKRIAEIRAAHRRHGGSGALYVYLRKKAR